MRFIEVSASSRSSSAKLGINTCLCTAISRTIRTANSSASSEIILERIFIRPFVPEIPTYGGTAVLFQVGRRPSSARNETWITFASGAARALEEGQSARNPDQAA